MKPSKCLKQFGILLFLLAMCLTGMLSCGRASGPDSRNPVGPSPAGFSSTDSATMPNQPDQGGPTSGHPVELGPQPTESSDRQARSFGTYLGEFNGVAAYSNERGLPRSLLKFSGGSGDILRDVLH